MIHRLGSVDGARAMAKQDVWLRYGIPFGEAEIDLSAVVKALHDFLAANRHKLARGNGVVPLLAGLNSPALERSGFARAKE